MRWKRWFLAALLVPLIAACESDAEPEPGEEPPAAAPTGSPGETVTVDLDDRPFRLHIPASYDPATPAPLVLLLHGFTSSSVEQESYFKLGAESDRRGFLYALPEGTTDPDGEQFWNATDACCDFHRSDVDDSGYLRSLIDTVAASYPVDPARVYVVGHSNGGFMAYRLACEHADVLTAIVSLAGAATDDPSQCTPERPVSVLQIHGTSDTTIPFDGGANAGRPFPSVETTLAMWRERNGCTDESETAEPLDLDSGVDGAETTVTSYAAGCGEGSRVELWSIADGGHVPPLTEDFAPAVVDFLYARTSPA
jgi:polyhydroxybutyrate depolymerase